MLPQVNMEARVVDDPTLRFTTSGMAVCNLRVVASSRKKEGDEWVDDRTCFIDVATFGALAENVAEHVTKSDLLVITGRLQMEQWEADGQKRSKHSVLADSIGRAVKRFKPREAQQQEAPAQPVGGSDEPPF